MDWFTAPEAPTQVAIVGVLAGLVTAAAAVVVAIVNNRRAGGGRAEITALTVDSSSIKLVAAAIEALNMTIIEQNKIAKDGGGEMVQVLGEVAKEVEELRRRFARSAASKSSRNAFAAPGGLTSISRQ